jgi:hypothetical protein
LSSVPKVKVTRVDSDAAREDRDHDSGGPEEENLKFVRRAHW